MLVQLTAADIVSGYEKMERRRKQGRITPDDNVVLSSSIM
jgi:hypothetical protein